MIRTNCPTCSKQLSVDDNLVIGERSPFFGYCPHCDQILVGIWLPREIAGMHTTSSSHLFLGTIENKKRGDVSQERLEIQDMWIQFKKIEDRNVTT